MSHKLIPRPELLTLSKADLLRQLMRVDGDRNSSGRVLALETDFRARIRHHLQNLPTSGARFARLNTSPFVLLFYSLQHGLTRIREIEKAILPAKVFSSMETSAGRMIEAVVLPKYGWELAPSAMHSVNSVIDGKTMREGTLCLATLKSGPRCLNDEMSENLADAIVANCETWAQAAGVGRIDFTYGVLYGTKKQSNKKDWHILRNIVGKLTEGVIERPEQRWRCRFVKNELDVTVTVRIGIELWNHIAGHDLAFMELCASLVRACIAPSDAEPIGSAYTISDLEPIVSLTDIPESFNTTILQRSQWEWLFFLARHFCDELVPGDTASLTPMG